MGLALTTPSMAGVEYLVCGTLGWVPIVGPLLSPILCQISQVLKVGDTLLFNGPLGTVLPVYEVTAAAFATCDIGNLLPVGTLGLPVSIPLVAPGTRYFIADPINCLLGFKTNVTIASA
ncbi:OLC1v1025240C1 [Oldenlandia corymbosa var. corymbosa]|uniref:OLC1v1025240C1 n=1 Tax=Oldenlandia corymbosa var. corymbosa TaxID=529605 RepID=A0AAV1C7A4_OLDCO|nr:OLC1v1025240C1 [Oldenlandia corymbosa var. corymbosa]